MPLAYPASDEIHGQAKVMRKTDDWLYLLGEIMERCAIRSLVDEAEVIGEMIKSKKERLRKLHTAKTGVMKTLPPIFRVQGLICPLAISNRLNGKTTSRVERAMRTINVRIKSE